jgi:acyl carrier protein
MLGKLIANVRRCEPDAIDPTRGFLDAGLSSYELVESVLRIERLLNKKLSPTLLLEHANLRELASHLHAQFSALFDSADVETISASTVAPYSALRHESTRADGFTRYTIDRPMQESRFASFLPDDAEPEVFRNFRMGKVSLEEVLTLIKKEGAMQ